VGWKKPEKRKHEGATCKKNWRKKLTSARRWFTGRPTSREKGRQTPRLMGGKKVRSPDLNRGDRLPAKHGGKHKGRSGTLRTEKASRENGKTLEKSVKSRKEAGRVVGIKSAKGPQKK